MSRWDCGALSPPAGVGVCRHSTVRMAIVQQRACASHYWAASIGPHTTSLPHSPLADCRRMRASTASPRSRVRDRAVRHRVRGRSLSEGERCEHPSPVPCAGGSGRDPPGPAAQDPHHQPSQAPEQGAGGVPIGRSARSLQSQECTCDTKLYVVFFLERHAGGWSNDLPSKSLARRHRGLGHRPSGPLEVVISHVSICATFPLWPNGEPPPRSAPA